MGCAVIAGAAPPPLQVSPDAQRKAVSSTSSDHDAGKNQPQGIVATVNDEAISYFDLSQRVKLMVTSSGFQPSTEERKELETQVVRNLIDEKLKAQEIKRLEVTVDNKEIVEQLEAIAQRSNSTVPELRADLERRGISVYTLTDQIKVEMGWNRLVDGRYGREAKVPEDEIRRIIDEARANAGKPQFHVVEIYLPVDQARDESKVLAQARSILDQIHKGAAFPQLAQQYSQSSTAALGGDAGWVTLGQLPEELDRWVRAAHRGMLTTEPIRTISGYYIVGVRDTRNVASGPTSAQTPLFLKRVVVPLSANASAERARQVVTQMKTAAGLIRGCNALPDAVKAISGAKIVDLGTKNIAQLEPRDQMRVARLVSGQASEAGDRTNEGFDMIVLCGHAEEQAQGVPTHDQIADRLYQQQMSMLSRRYLRDLRGGAYIVNRLGNDE